MKTCPKCGASYANDLSFCLQDGTPLPAGSTAGISNAPTEAFRPGTNPLDGISNAETIVGYPTKTQPSPAKQYQLSAINPSNKMGCVVTVGTISTLFLVVFGLGIFSLLSSRQNMSSSEPAFSNSVTESTNYNTDSSNSGVYTDPASPPTRAENNSKTISGGVLNGKATSLPKPAYPPAARAVRASGAVSVQVLVDEQGNVVSANAVSGHPLLRAVAASAARGAKFEPTLLSGKPVRVSGVLTYAFVPE